LKHEELQDKLRKAFGGKVPMDARDRWSKFIKGKELSFEIDYNWIKDKRFVRWAEDHPDLDFGEGVTTVIVSILR
jgi:hypothetical protein